MNILNLIQNKYSSFSKGQKRIASYVTDHYDKAVYMTASRLGEETDVSESTVVRFAIEMGFDGYPEFQNALKEFVRNQLTTLQRVEATDAIIGDGDLPDKVLSFDSERIHKTLEQLDKTAFRKAVDTLCKAKRIFIAGAGSSSVLASFLSYNYRMIADNSILVGTASVEEIFEQMLSIEKGDVFFAISFPRYSNRIVKAVQYAKDKDANVIALTDNNDSPIASLADETLTAQSDMVSFGDNLVAPLSLLNAILVAVTKEKQEEITERLHKLEQIWDDYDVYSGKK